MPIAQRRSVVAFRVKRCQSLSVLFGDRSASAHRGYPKRLRHRSFEVSALPYDAESDPKLEAEPAWRGPWSLTSLTGGSPNMRLYSLLN